MKIAAVIFVLAGLLGAPIACAIVVCPAVTAHDCCPKTKSFTACPFDILDSAKAVFPATVGVIFQAVTIQIQWFTLEPLESAAADRRDLHLKNRVLRI